MKKILILASKSPRRIDILKKNKIEFKIIPAKITEISRYKRPDLMVKELAYKKALKVAMSNRDNPVLAADTIVYLKNKVIGKPENKKEALKLLKLQNGKWQRVYTGVALIWLEKEIFLCDFEVSRCLARKLNESELKKLSGKHLDKAGGYAVQDENDYFIKKIEGDFDNVVGLPMNIVRKFLKKINYMEIR